MLHAVLLIALAAPRDAPVREVNPLVIGFAQLSTDELRAERERLGRVRPSFLPGLITLAGGGGAGLLTAITLWVVSFEQSLRNVCINFFPTLGGGGCNGFRNPAAAVVTEQTRIAGVVAVGVGAVAAVVGAFLLRANVAARRPYSEAMDAADAELERRENPAGDVTTPVRPQAPSPLGPPVVPPPPELPPLPPPVP